MIGGELPEKIHLSCLFCDTKFEIYNEINQFACSKCGNEFYIEKSGGVVYINPVNDINKQQIDKQYYQIKKAFLHLNIKI